jgi:transcriptional regulator with XRE-family HTH domain
LEYANAEYYDGPPNMVKAIFSKDHKYTVEQLKKARREAGLNQAEVATLLNKTQSHVSKVEAGQRRIDIVMLKEFAQIYKKSLDYFLKP